MVLLFLGKSFFIAQFVKGMPYSELDTFKRIPEIELQQYGLACFIKNKPSHKDIGNRMFIGP